MNIAIGFIEGVLEKLVNFIMALVPYERPAPSKLKNVKIVAHRTFGTNHPENSIAAIHELLLAGVWGVELDIRFTKDHVPILSHDLNLKRCFGIDRDISSLTFHELYQLKTSVPTLAEVVSTFGHKIHLMIEIKSNFGGFSPFASISLREALQDLTPLRDYHLMSLEPYDFAAFHWLPRVACLSISTLNPRKISEQTLALNLGGITGHFILLTRSLRKKHALASQKIGTGFITSQNVLHREINADTDWLFSNNPLELQKSINDSV